MRQTKSLRRSSSVPATDKRNTPSFPINAKAPYLALLSKQIKDTEAQIMKVISPCS